MLFWMHPRTSLAFLITRAHSWFIGIILYTRTPYQQVSSQPVLVHEVILPQVQDFTLLPVEHHESVKVSLDGSVGPLSNQPFVQDCIFVKNSLCLIIQVLADVKQDWAQYWPEGPPPITGFQLESVWCSIIPWAWRLTQLPLHLALCLFSLYFIGVIKYAQERIFWMVLA